MSTSAAQPDDNSNDKRNRERERTAGTCTTNPQQKPAATSPVKKASSLLSMLGGSNKQAAQTSDSSASTPGIQVLETVEEVTGKLPMPAVKEAKTGGSSSSSSSSSGDFGGKPKLIKVPVKFGGTGSGASGSGSGSGSGSDSAGGRPPRTNSSPLDVRSLENNAVGKADTVVPGVVDVTAMEFRRVEKRPPRPSGSSSSSSSAAILASRSSHTHFYTAAEMRAVAMAMQEVADLGAEAPSESMQVYYSEKEAWLKEQDLPLVHNTPLLWSALKAKSGGGGGSSSSSSSSGSSAEQRYKTPPNAQRVQLNAAPPGFGGGDGGTAGPGGPPAGFHADKWSKGTAVASSAEGGKPPRQQPANKGGRKTTDELRKEVEAERLLFQAQRAGGAAGGGGGGNSSSSGGSSGTYHDTTDEVMKDLLAESAVNNKKQASTPPPVTRPDPASWGDNSAAAGAAFDLPSAPISNDEDSAAIRAMFTPNSSEVGAGGVDEVASGIVDFAATINSATAMPTGGSSGKANSRLFNWVQSPSTIDSGVGASPVTVDGQPQVQPLVASLGSLEATDAVGGVGLGVPKSNSGTDLSLDNLLGGLSTATTASSSTPADFGVINLSSLELGGSLGAGIVGGDGDSDGDGGLMSRDVSTASTMPSKQLASSMTSMLLDGESRANSGASDGAPLPPAVPAAAASVATSSAAPQHKNLTPHQKNQQRLQQTQLQQRRIAELKGHHATLKNQQQQLLAKASGSPAPGPTAPPAETNVAARASPVIGNISGGSSPALASASLPQQVQVQNASNNVNMQQHNHVQQMMTQQQQMQHHLQQQQATMMTQQLPQHPSGLQSGGIVNSVNPNGGGSNQQHQLNPAGRNRGTVNLLSRLGLDRGTASAPAAAAQNAPPATVQVLTFAEVQEQQQKAQRQTPTKAASPSPSNVPATPEAAAVPHTFAFHETSPQSKSQNAPASTPPAQSLPSSQGGSGSKPAGSTSGGKAMNPALRRLQVLSKQKLGGTSVTGASTTVDGQTVRRVNLQGLFNKNAATTAAPAATAKK